jgi:hypothetical protein
MIYSGKPAWDVSLSHCPHNYHPAALESRRSSTASERKGARGLRASLTRGKSLTRTRSKSPFRSFRFRKSKADADTTYSDEEGGETFRLIGRSGSGTVPAALSTEREFCSSGSYNLADI